MKLKKILDKLKEKRMDSTKKDLDEFVNKLLVEENSKESNEYDLDKFKKYYNTALEKAKKLGIDTTDYETRLSKGELLRVI